MLEAKLNHDEVIKAYTSNAPVYDIWAWLTESRARKQAVEYADVQDGEAILEVAVGTGLTFYELVKRNPCGINRGIDLTPAMVKRATNRVATLSGDITIGLGDAISLDFDSNSFDLLVNNYMFDLLPEERFMQQLEEFSRVLKPGGRLVITNMAKPRRMWHALYETIYRLSPALMGGCRGVELDEALKIAGFEVEDKKYFSQFGFPSEVIVTSMTPC